MAVTSDANMHQNMHWNVTTMTNHPKDRHVLAPAARAGAKIIVTYNIKDFPGSSPAPYSIRAHRPSFFLKNLYAAAPAMVMQALEDQAAAIGKSMAYLLSRLQNNVPAFVEMDREKALVESQIKVTLVRQSI